MSFNDDNYESIDDIALSEGFYIDDDGHWCELNMEYFLEDEELFKKIWDMFEDGRFV